MEEPVAAQLREVGFRRALGQEFSVDAAALDLLDVVDLHSGHELHRHDALGRQVPVYLRHLQEDESVTSPNHDGVGCRHRQLACGAPCV